MYTYGSSFYCGNIDDNINRNEFGKGLLKNGSIFIGNYNKNLMSDGKLYEL